MGNIFRAILENVGDKTHGGLRREDVGAACRILFQDVILNGSVQFVGADALFLSNGNVHGQQNRCRRIDRHRSGDFAEIDLVEQDFHVGQGVDRYANLADFTLCFGVVGVKADLGRQVECAGESRSARLEQIAISLVGLFGSREAGIHTHGPETATVHGGLHATGKRILARHAEVLLIVEALDVQRSSQSQLGQVDSLGVLGESLLDFGVECFLLSF